MGAHRSETRLPTNTNLPLYRRFSATSADQNLRPDSVATSDHALVTLTMIVRDEEKNLPRCLDSVRGLFDEIVVLDTGSKDRTIEIARSYGARVAEPGGTGEGTRGS